MCDKWISVDEALPETEKQVLVYYRYKWGAGFTAYGYGISNHHKVDNRWNNFGIPRDCEILSWQTLPEPPETIKG